MRKTKLWVITGTLFMSLLVGAAVGRMAGGGSAGADPTWSPPLITATVAAPSEPTATAGAPPSSTPSATPVVTNQ